MAKKRVYEYEAESIRVTWDRGRCIHAEECVNSLPEVFDPERRPWIDPSEAPAERVAEAVRRCPTGALQYRSETVEDESDGPSSEFRLETDGPIYLRGAVRIETDDGDEIVRDTRVALCRCGASKIKPFCDGSHTEIGWSSEDG